MLTFVVPGDAAGWTGTSYEALGRLRALSLEEYMADQVYAGRYLVQAAAQTCIDLASHVIASEGWRAPRNVSDVFSVLAENRVIDTQLAGRLRAMAGLGNRLVPVDGEIDDALVHGSFSSLSPGCRSRGCRTGRARGSARRGRRRTRLGQDPAEAVRIRHGRGRRVAERGESRPVLYPGGPCS